MTVFLYVLILCIELLVLVTVAIYSLALVYSSVKGAPFVPTSKKRIDEILKEANLQKGHTFIELGCGDGRVVRYAVKKYGVTGIGIEVNPILTLLSRLYAKAENLRNVVFKTENVLSTDLNKAHVIYLFLMPQLILKLLPKLSQLPSGTVLISHGFKIQGWEKKLFKTVHSEPFSTFYYRI